MSVLFCSVLQVPSGYVYVPDHTMAGVRSMMSALLLIAVMASMTSSAAAAEDGTWQVEFMVQLKKGVKGSFVVEVHPDW